MGLWAVIAWGSLLLLLLALISFLLFCGYLHYIHMKYDHIPGPPRDSFFLGHLPTMTRLMKNNEVIYDYFLDWALEYGPIVRIYVVHKVLILVASPEGVKELLMSAKYPKDPHYDEMFYMFGTRYLGHSILTERYYNQWHKQRRVMDPAFSRTYLVGLMGTFNEKAEELMEKLTVNAEQKSEVTMHTLFNRMTLDIIAKVAFDMDLNALHDDQTPFPQAIVMVMRGMFESRNPLVQFFPWKRKLIREIQEAARLLRRTGKECIDRRKQLLKEGREVPDDILTKILKGAAMEETYDEELMIDNFVTFFIAGQETTANHIAFVVLELAKHPEILEKVQAEVDEVIGSKRDIQYEDLGKLHYMTQVLKETLRMYPTVPGTTRLVEEEIVLEGLRIPANTTVLNIACAIVCIWQINAIKFIQRQLENSSYKIFAQTNSYVTCRMEQYFKDPFTFDPERFAPGAPRPYFTYYPFSLGPRTCIGQAFSQVEVKVVISKLIQRFEFQLVEGQTFNILDMGTLRPMSGVICKIKPRTNLNGNKKPF